MKKTNKLVIVMNLAIMILCIAFVEFYKCVHISSNIKENIELRGATGVFVLLSLICVIICVILNIIIAIKNFKSKNTKLGICFILEQIGIITFFIEAFSNIKIEEIFELIIISSTLSISIIALIFNRKVEDTSKCSKKTLIFYIIFILVIVIIPIIAIADYLISYSNINSKLSNIQEDLKLSECVGVKNKDAYQFIDENGNIKFQIECDEITPFYRYKMDDLIKEVDIAVMEKNGKICIIDSNGDVLYSISNLEKSYKVILKNFDRIYLGTSLNDNYFDDEKEQYIAISGEYYESKEELKDYEDDEYVAIINLTTENLRYNYYRISKDMVVEEKINLNSNMSDVNQLIKVNYEVEVNLINIDTKNRTKIECDNLIHETSKYENSDSVIYIFRNGYIPFEKKSDNKKGFCNVKTGEIVTVPYNYSIIDFIGDYILIDYQKENYYGKLEDYYFCIDEEGNKKTDLFSNVFIQKEDKINIYELGNKIIFNKFEDIYDDICMKDKYIVYTENEAYIIDKNLNKVGKSYDYMFLSENSNSILAYDLSNNELKEKIKKEYADFGVSEKYVCLQSELRNLDGNFSIVNIETGEKLTNDKYERPCINLELPENDFIYESKK